MKSIKILENPIQEYAWGSMTAIADLLGEKHISGKPQAEMWMGAHPKAPSRVDIDGGSVSLLKMIEQDPVNLLGEAVADRFSNRLPFLFKVLAAAKPLSIQAHPDLSRARKGFERENRLGIPLSASSRNYRDNNHKPECICALSSFWALCGFRDIPEIIKNFNRLGPEALKGEIEMLGNRPDARGLKAFFGKLLSLEPNRKKKIIAAVTEKAQHLGQTDIESEWVLKLNHEYPDDIGILAPLFLNLISMEPQQAMFLPAGELHAYLEGVGVELMANSDNVIRGGLTTKNVDVPELLNILNFEKREVRVLIPERISRNESIYSTCADEFRLDLISVNGANPYHSPDKRGVEIYLCTKGNAITKDMDEKSIKITRGTSFIVPSCLKGFRIKGEAELYRASVPRPKNKAKKP